MRRAIGAAAVAGLAGAVVVLGGSTPAGAEVVVSSSGTTVTVTVTGAATIDFGCSSPAPRVVQVNGVSVAPAVACGSLTKVTVNAASGDTAGQTVYGSDLASSTFAAKPSLVANLLGGRDIVTDTPRPDTINSGGGSDLVTLTGTTTETSVSLGAELDYLTYNGTSESETLTFSSTGATLSILRTGSVSFSTTVAGAENLEVHGGAGNDTLDTTGIISSPGGGSTIGQVDLEGEAGNDTVNGNDPVSDQTTLGGGSGTNVITARALNVVSTQSSTDTLNLVGDDTSITDEVSLHAGGRTISIGAKKYVYRTKLLDGDTVVRVRNAPAGSALMTTSLAREGQQVLPDGLTSVVLALNRGSSSQRAQLVDAEALGNGRTVAVEFSAGGSTRLADVTVPTGTWSVTAGFGGTTVDPTDAQYGSLTFSGIGFTAAQVKAHAPWTDPNQSFAHRVTRDLMFRFVSDADRISIGASLAAGTIHRDDLVGLLMKSDEYRGLDVDRSFRDFLRRSADASGRAYWIGAISDGRSLPRFRAQIIGSNEYFARAGGSNRAYVSAAYNDILGRAPDTAGLDYWTGRLDAGGDRGSVALGFLTSTEARRTIIKDQFLRFLDRYPTTTETDTWVANMGASSTGEQDLIAFLANSSSYFSRS